MNNKQDLNEFIQKSINLAKNEKPPQQIKTTSICFNCLNFAKETNYCPYYPKKDFAFFNEKSKCIYYLKSIKDINILLNISIVGYKQTEISLSTLTKEIEKWIDNFIPDFFQQDFINQLQFNKKISNNNITREELFDYRYSTRYISNDFMQQVDIYKTAYQDLQKSILISNKTSNSLFKTLNTYNTAINKYQNLLFERTQELRTLKTLLYSKRLKQELFNLLNTIPSDSNKYPHSKNLLKFLTSVGVG